MAQAEAVEEAQAGDAVNRRSFLSALIAAPLVPVAMVAVRSERPLLTVNPMSRTIAQMTCEGIWLNGEKIYFDHCPEFREITWSYPNDASPSSGDA